VVELGLGPFCGSETPIFHYAGGGEFVKVFVDRNGGERRSLVVTVRGLSMTRRVRSVIAGVRHGTVGLCTGASGRSWDRRVRSSPKEAAKHARSIGRGGASGHDRSDTSGRKRVLTGNDQTLALWHPIRLAACPVAGSLAHGCA
jgi:hypothetical protein